LSEKPSIIYDVVNIKTLIEEVIDLLKLRADIRNLKLYFILNPNVPKIFYTDP